MSFEKLIALERCRSGAGTFVEHRGRELAVFRVGGEQEVHVTDNSCPHASGNLSGGEVVDGVVSCPWHHWQFDLTSGKCPHSAEAKVKVYPAEVRDGVVWVDLDASPV